MMKNFYLLIIVSLFGFTISGCQEEPLEPVCSPYDVPSLSPIEILFLELAFQEEFGNNSTGLRKWEKDIRIFIGGTPPTVGLNELDAVMGEINALSQSVRLLQVADQRQSDLVVFFGAKTDYLSEIEPDAEGFIGNSNGFSAIRWNNSGAITRASAFIDIENIQDENLLRHIVREEISQTLGLINDTEQYPDSIFFQGDSQQTTYSEQDKQLITFILHPSLRAGMCDGDALAAISDLL